MISVDTDLHLTISDIIKIVGYVAMTVGAYFAIRLDNKLLHQKFINLAEKNKETKFIALDAQDKIYQHVTNSHIHLGTERRRTVVHKSQDEDLL